MSLPKPRILRAALALSVVALALGASTAYAQREGHEGGGRRVEAQRYNGPRYAFHGRDVRAFGPRDLGLWRGGYWRHSCSFGRCGWWWFVGGFWYFYDQPVYPYPYAVSPYQYDYYGNPVVVPSAVAPAPVVVAPVAPAPVVVAPQPAQPTQIAPAPKFSYYCDNPAGYYPTVSSCPSGFRAVAPVPGH